LSLIKAKEAKDRINGIKKKKEQFRVILDEKLNRAQQLREEHLKTIQEKAKLEEKKRNEVLYNYIHT
jgi:hypothetical protein